MSDNPKKKKLDGKRVSEQPWEQAYQRKKNARKKKEAVASLKISQQDPGDHPGKKQLAGRSYKRSGVTILDKRKLQSALLKMENAVLQNSIRGKGSVEFCKEWEEKGKPIFNMVLVLFTFSAKIKATIRRIMNGIDGVCKIPEPVVES